MCKQPGNIFIDGWHMLCIWWAGFDEAAWAGCTPGHAVMAVMGHQSWWLPVVKATLVISPCTKNHGNILGTSITCI